MTAKKTMKNGTVKKVTESYRIDTFSFTEAETRIIEEVTPYIRGDFTVYLGGQYDGRNHRTDDSPCLALPSPSPRASTPSLPVGSVGQAPFSLCSRTRSNSDPALSRSGRPPVLV